MISLRDTPSAGSRQALRLSGKGLRPSALPSFQQLKVKLRRMLGEDVAFDNLDC